MARIARMPSVGRPDTSAPAEAGTVWTVESSDQVHLATIYQHSSGGYGADVTLDAGPHSALTIVGAGLPRLPETRPDDKSLTPLSWRLVVREVAALLARDGWVVEWPGLDPDIDQELTQLLQVLGAPQVEPVSLTVTMAGYAAEAQKTAIYPGSGTSMGLAYAALGLAGEAGEIANKAKKVLRDSNGELTQERRAAMAAELGDVLWYIAALAKELDVSLAQVAQANLDKLASRQARGTLQGSGDQR